MGSYHQISKPHHEKANKNFIKPIHGAHQPYKSQSHQGAKPCESSANKSSESSATLPHLQPERV